MKLKILALTESERNELTFGFRNGETHFFRMRCRCVLLKSEGLSSIQVGLQTEMTAQSVNSWVKRFETEGIQGLFTRAGQGGMAKFLRQRSERFDLQTFFIRLGARYRRIRKRPKGIPSPQLYAYKKEKLQELETLYAKGEINLFYGDESHVCTEGYVPYGWQFPGENVYIPSERAKRLNIFGMIDRDNHFEGFSTSETIDAKKVFNFLDEYSFNINKKTFVVLDNKRTSK